ncbi:MAG: hypothetical protein ACRELF_24420, partial [Gemmataceae bacterium]
PTTLLTLLFYDPNTTIGKHHLPQFSTRYPRKSSRTNQRMKKQIADGLYSEPLQNDKQGPRSATVEPACESVRCSTDAARKNGLAPAATRHIL